MIYFLVGIIIFGVLVLLTLGRLVRLRPTRLDRKYFEFKWAELLARVKTPEGMLLAVIDADKLLDEALRKHHLRGKTMGERLVSAQKLLSDNDAVWYAHKLRNRLVHEPNVRLKKSEAKNALAGFKQGLHDLGAL
ncbi:MAG TPA: hypothetical protein VFW90_02300 [Candidatus Saccharimonadales bacterium]|nr:hypothetical protein [Candidatus Saccharimonadales bacterium]